ncbi:MAG: hypothetical protein K0Q72_4608, partial [Armatimonadetes bacterium]|nr:hypothetical protein [Armatimonadota bacterium]
HECRRDLFDTRPWLTSPGAGYSSYPTPEPEELPRPGEPVRRLSGNAASGVNGYTGHYN